MRKSLCCVKRVNTTKLLLENKVLNIFKYENNPSGIVQPTVSSPEMKIYTGYLNIKSNSNNSKIKIVCFESINM